LVRKFLFIFQISYLFYFSLRSNDDQESFWSEYAGSTMQKHWICPYCNEDILVTVAERVAHENQCQLNCKYFSRKLKNKDIRKVYYFHVEILSKG
jgi:hypothetical protein